MTTKDDGLSFKDKHKGVAENVSGDQYRNLNLNNQNHDCVFEEIYRPKNIAFDNKKSQNYDHSNDLKSKKASNSWSKSDDKHLSTTFLNLNRESEEERDLKKSKSANNSTLSLHIAAYENSIETSNDSGGREKKVETSNFIKKWEALKHLGDDSTLIIQNPFEFPRQQDDQDNRPELMQFAASQTLLNPNQMNANNQVRPPPNSMEIEDISNIVLDDDEASFEVVEEEEKSIELPEDIKNLQIIELRERLIKAGFPPGPVTITTQSMYKKKLFIQEMKNFKEYGVRENLLPFEKLIYQIKHGLSITIGVQENAKLQEAFDKIRECKKEFFNYFLIDPTKIKNLDNSTFEEFREAIDYVGKGSGNRALAQLKNAALLKQGKEIPNKKDAEKLKRIGKIWEKGSGVIIVHPFSYMSENESFFRESSIIAALGIDCLANERNGHNNHKLLPPGTRRWADHEIILLGVYCVYNAYLLFCRDRRQQIYEGDALK